MIGYSIEGGAYAEFIAIDVQKVALKPKSVDHIEAASLALVAQTAIQMVDRANVEEGSTVLIHGPGARSEVSLCRRLIIGEPQLSAPHRPGAWNV